MSFSAVTLLAGRQEEHPACNWRGYSLEQAANDLHMIQLMPLPVPPHHLLLH